MKKPPATPFPSIGYYGKAFFCNRKAELAQLGHMTTGGIPVVIFGIRRLGKTGLIYRFFDDNRHKRIFVDLQATTSLGELVTRLADGIGRAYPEKAHAKTWQFLKSFRPTVRFDPLSGAPKFSFNIQKVDEVKQTLQSLLYMLSEKKDQVMIAFDEFQEVNSYGEPSVEGILRSEIQRFPSLGYIFSGSKSRVLTRMFQDGSRPFFSNAGKIYLDKLDESDYFKFAKKKFVKASKQISDELLTEVFRWTETHTYYTQYVFNQLFLQSGKQVDLDLLNRVKWQILQSSKHDFLQVRELLTPGQRKILLAVGMEKELYQPFSSIHATRYKLGTPTGVKKSLNALVDRQIINELHSDTGERYYKLADVFMMRYISSHY